MLNQVMIVGRLVKDVEKEGNLAKIVLAVPRYFKNADGIYETDFIPCTLLGPIADNVLENCKKGDIAGIKGRIQSNNGIELIAEKVTFISSSQKPTETVE